MHPPSQAEGMISEIRAAFEEALGHLVWMDEKTRQAAKEKVMTPWTAAHRASLSITISQGLLRLLSVESVMPSNHLLPIPNYLGSFSSYLNDPRDIHKLPEATLPVAELDLLLCLPYTEPPSAALCST